MGFDCWVQISGWKNDGSTMSEGETHQVNQSGKYRFRAYLFTYIEPEGYIPLASKQVQLRKDGATYATVITDGNGLAWFPSSIEWYDAPPTGDSYVFDAVFAGDISFNPAVSGTITVEGVEGVPPPSPVPWNLVGLAVGSVVAVTAFVYYATKP